MRAKLGSPEGQLETLQRWRRTALGLTITATLAWSCGAWLHATSAPTLVGPEHCGGDAALWVVPGCPGLWAPRGSLEFRSYSLMCAPVEPALQSLGIDALLAPDQRHLALADQCLDDQQLLALARSPRVSIRHYAYHRASEHDAWTQELLEFALFDAEPFSECSEAGCEAISGRTLALRVLAGES